MALDPLKDLAPRYDVKGGSPRTPPRGIPVASVQQHLKSNGRHIQLPSLTNLLQILQIAAILFVAIAWWTKRESGSAVTFETQNLAIAANTKRMDAADKRFEAIDQRADKALETANRNGEDLHELMVKFRIMVELVDGQQKKPELRK